MAEVSRLRILQHREVRMSHLPSRTVELNKGDTDESGSGYRTVYGAAPRPYPSLEAMTKRRRVVMKPRRFMTTSRHNVTKCGDIMATSPGFVMERREMATTRGKVIAKCRDFATKSVDCGATRRRNVTKWSNIMTTWSRSMTKWRCIATKWRDVVTMWGDKGTKRGEIVTTRRDFVTTRGDVETKRRSCGATSRDVVATSACVVTA
jgi:hypothetical protein